MKTTIALSIQQRNELSIHIADILIVKATKNHIGYGIEVIPTPMYNTITKRRISGGFIAAANISGIIDKKLKRIIAYTSIEHEYPEYYGYKQNKITLFDSIRNKKNPLLKNK